MMDFTGSAGELSTFLDGGVSWLQFPVASEMTQMIYIKPTSTIYHQYTIIRIVIEISRKFVWSAWWHQGINNAD